VEQLTGATRSYIRLTHLFASASAGRASCLQMLCTKETVVRIIRRGLVALGAGAFAVPAAAGVYAEAHRAPDQP
jgi:hypothetical protein